MASWQFRVYKLMLWLQKRPQMLDGSRSIAEARLNQERLLSHLKPPPTSTCAAVMVDDVPAEWILADGVENGRIILYLHGGAYCLGSINTHRALAAHIGSAAQARTLIIDYRLAPEHHHPAALDDAAAAYKWLLTQGHSPQNIAVVGDSAGGGLTLAMLLKLREENVPMPGAAVTLSPWTDLAGTGTSMKQKRSVDYILSQQFLSKSAKMYTNGHSLENPFISPVYASFGKLPPLLIQVGTDEILLDDAIRLAEKAQADGVDVTLDVWERMLHVWQMGAPYIPEAKAAVAQIGAFIRQHT